MRLGDFLRACLRYKPLFWVASLLWALSCSSDERTPGELAAGCVIKLGLPRAAPLRVSNLPQRLRRNARLSGRASLRGERPALSRVPARVGACLHVPQRLPRRSGLRDRRAMSRPVSGDVRLPRRAAVRRGHVRRTRRAARRWAAGDLKDAAPPTGQSCSFNSQCPGRLVCRDGSCRLECLSSVDCKSGRECVANRCQVPLFVPRPTPGAARPARSTPSAPRRSYAEAGFCTCECRTAGDCPSGYECPSSRCVPGNIDSIGPEGGMLVSPDCRLTLEVPPGALTTRVHLTIQFAEAWPTGALGPVFEVRPTGTMFAAPVTFVLSLPTRRPLVPFSDLREFVSRWPRRRPGRGSRRSSTRRPARSRRKRPTFPPTAWWPRR